MKRIIATVIALIATVIIASPPALADVNDFTITNYEVKMHLSRDENNRSVLETTETITAQFPATDQNHGIERALPHSYDGHPVHLDIKSVTKPGGEDWNYSVKDGSGDYDVLRIGDKDSYVHGEQTYIIHYIQHDVTKYFADKNHDEFYWDINGDAWRVPIDNLQLTLTLDDDVAAAIDSTQSSCYQGVRGSNETCILRRETATTYTAQIADLRSGENMTVALGFTPQTFAAYEESLMDMFMRLWKIMLIITMFISMVGAVVILVLLSRSNNRDKELGTIVPEYTPPRDISVTVASKLSSKITGSSMTAQLLDLAVRHYIRLYEVKEKKWWRAAEYELEIIKDISELRAEEKEPLIDMFNGMPKVGDRKNLKGLRNNTSYSKRMLDNDRKLTGLIRETYQLRTKDEATKKRYRKVALVIFVLGVLLLSPPLLTLAALCYVLATVNVWRLTDEGLAHRRYVEGLKIYIDVAEEERIKMLQSPEGAEKVGVSLAGNDEVKLIKLYEKVLPYAVLFRKEKEWNKQLGKYYETTGQQPDWYTSHSGIYTAAAFSSSMSSLSSAANYGNSSSSSSGGAGGGGSSGGGGGGGGGGGW